MRARRGLALIAATTLLFVAVPASAASADPPDVDRIPQGTQSITHLDECPFPVQEETTVGQLINTTFYSKDGSIRTIHVAGSFHGTLTNLDTGKSIQINFSGAGNIDPETGSLLAHGPFFIGSPDDPATPEFDGYEVLLRGTSEASIDFGTFVVTIQSTTAPVYEICVALS